MSVINCKAAVIKDPKVSKLLEIEDVLVDPPKVGEVRVKIISTGLCHSDLYVIENTKMNGVELPNGPSILGHEASGIIESIGENVNYVVPDDHVVVLWMNQCDKCTLCVSNPKSNFCEAGNINTGHLRYDGTSRIHLASDKTPLLTFGSTGTFSQYITLPEENVCKIPPEFPMEVASLLGCAIGTGYGSVINVAKIHSGSVCGIYGLGAVGLAALMGCKVGGASIIVAIDVNEDKFNIARELGATHFINPSKISSQDPNFMGDIFKSGLDYVFECSGSTKALESGMKNMAPWATMVLVGLQPQGAEIKIDTSLLTGGQVFTGALYGGYKARQGIKSLIQAYEDNKLNIKPFITRRIKLEEVNEGFELLKQGKAIRSIIDM